MCCLVGIGPLRALSRVVPQSLLGTLQLGECPYVSQMPRQCSSHLQSHFMPSAHSACLMAQWLSVQCLACPPVLCFLPIFSHSALPMIKITILVGSSASQTPWINTGSSIKEVSCRGIFSKQPLPTRADEPATHTLLPSLLLEG